MSERELHNAYMREKLECSCGSYISRVNMSRHMETESHIKIVDKEAYIKLTKDKYEKKINKLKREKKKVLRKIDKEIEQSKVNDI